jgi:hypothetical protein
VRCKVLCSAAVFHPELESLDHVLILPCQS